MAPRSRGLARICRAAATLSVSLFVLTGTSSAGAVVDRLDKFRELVSERLGAGHVLDPDAAHAAYREAYALLDEEIVESLSSGGVFASAAFLQDRLDGFSDTWGGAAARIVRLGPLTIGVFQLGERAVGNSVRVYGRLRDEVALLSATERSGRPTLYPLPAGPGGAVQFLVAWDDTPSGTGARPVRLDVMRQHTDGVRTVWSSADVYPERLIAREYTVRGQELRVRYQVRYPGWVAGCEGQTELEDVFRFAPASGTYSRTAQRSFDGWHRELRAAASQLFTAVATSDRRTLTALVPDVRVRDRLPRTLESEPVCDAPAGPRGEQVSVAASDGDGAPWTLLFQRDGGRWRVNAATRVIP